MARRAKKPTEKPRPRGRPPKPVPTIAELTRKAAGGVGKMTQAEIHALARSKKDLASINANKDWSLAELEERARNGTITQSQIKVLVELRRAIAQAQPTGPQVRAVRSVREKLEEVEAVGVDVLFDVARNGSAVARVQAVKELRQWAAYKGIGADDTEAEEIHFMDLEHIQPIDEDLQAVG